MKKNESNEKQEKTLENMLIACLNFLLGSRRGFAILLLLIVLVMLVPLILSINENALEKETLERDFKPLIMRVISGEGEMVEIPSGLNYLQTVGKMRNFGILTSEQAEAARKVVFWVQIPPSKDAAKKIASPTTSHP